MIFYCQKSDILNAFLDCSKAISPRTTMEILECFYIEASNDEVRITGNNMELGIKKTIPAKVEEAGIVCINNKMITEIIRKSQDEMIRIAIDDSYQCSVTYGKSKAVISGRSGEDYPVLTEIDKTNCVKISKMGLKNIISQTIFAISDNETTKVLTGEHFEINEDELTVSACDGHRIAIRKIKLKESYPRYDIVIPGKSLLEVNRLIPGDADSDVSIYITSNSIMFEYDNTIVLSRLIDAKYLSINQMISNDYETKIVVNKKMLFESLDRSTLFVRESEKKPIIFNIYDERMAIKMNTTIGSYDDELDIEREGKGIMIGFNPKFFIDVIRAIDDDEEITIYMTNAKSPCFIRNAEGTYNYLVLPVQFNSSAN